MRASQGFQQLPNQPNTHGFGQGRQLVNSTPNNSVPILSLSLSDVSAFDESEPAVGLLESQEIHEEASAFEQTNNLMHSPLPFNNEPAIDEALPDRSSASTDSNKRAIALQEEQKQED